LTSSYNANLVRTITMEDGEAMFHRGHVCRVLAYVDARQAIRQDCKQLKILRPVNLTGLNQNPVESIFSPNPASTSYQFNLSLTAFMVDGNQL
jgi:hypothetical protein